jgi:hypothetical protein
LRLATTSASYAAVLRILLILILAAPTHLTAQRVKLAIAGGNEQLSLDHLRQTLHWRTAQPGLAVAEVDLRAGAWRWPVRAIVVRIEPDSFDMELVLSTRANGMTGRWNVDSAALDVAFALNAGQFKETGPWGWVVLNSYERRDPGYGPLSAGIAFDTAGRVHWIGHADLAKARNDRTVRFAFQSYPLLLMNGAVPPMLYASDDVDRDHRDARLILGQMPDGALVVVLTRYAGLGGTASRIPVGLTVPESVDFMRALGADHAVMLDGGISAQMLVRQEGGAAYKWNGLRNVPLALIARPRAR